MQLIDNFKMFAEHGNRGTALLEYFDRTLIMFNWFLQYNLGVVDPISFNLLKVILVHMHSNFPLVVCPVEN